MKELHFEWDQRKEKGNVKKHGVSFEEARTAFYFVLLGLSLKPWVLVVCHCFRESETVIRIVSARKADKDEELEYWKRRK